MIVASTGCWLSRCYWPRAKRERIGVDLYAMLLSSTKLVQDPTHNRFRLIPSPSTLVDSAINRFRLILNQSVSADSDSIDFAWFWINRFRLILDQSISVGVYLQACIASVQHACSSPLAKTMRQRITPFLARTADERFVCVVLTGTRYIR